jgi:hypothetical protein
VHLVEEEPAMFGRFEALKLIAAPADVGSGAR